MQPSQDISPQPNVQPVNSSKSLLHPWRLSFTTTTCGSSSRVQRLLASGSLICRTLAHALQHSSLPKLALICLGARESARLVHFNILGSASHCSTFINIQIMRRVLMRWRRACYIHAVLNKPCVQVPFPKNIYRECGDRSLVDPVF